MSQILAALLGITITSLANSAEYVEIIMKKNGEQIQGNIVEEVPGESITLETPTGNQFLIKVAEIEKITKKESTGSKQKNDRPEGVPSIHNSDRKIPWGTEFMCFGGYTTISLANFNDNISKSISSYKTHSYTPITNGLYGGGEILFRSPTGIGIGIRAYLLQTAEGPFSIGNTFGPLNSGYTANGKYDFRLIPIYFGIHYTYRRPYFSGTAGLYPGWALGEMNYEIKNYLSGVNDGTGGIGIGRGNGPAFEGKIGARFDPKKFFIGLDVGYRYVLIPQMDWEITSPSGRKYKSETYSEIIDFDFSGFNIGVTLGIYF